MGGHRVQGRAGGHQAGGRDRLLADAKAVEAAGAFSVVLEGMPRDLAAEITANLSIPTIGIGAGPDCDGQVLVLHDVLGLTPNLYKFAKAYAHLRADVVGALEAYGRDVRAGAFPDDAHSFH
jgi:3-methyl-2-oxobutanoate hydroxymethyltransferase